MNDELRCLGSGMDAMLRPLGDDVVIHRVVAEDRASIAAGLSNPFGEDFDTEAFRTTGYIIDETFKGRLVVPGATRLLALWVGDLAFVPRLNDVVLLDGSPYTVIAVEPIPRGAPPALFYAALIHQGTGGQRHLDA